MSHTTTSFTVPFTANAPLRVLHVVPTFYPATRWGGPTFSTLALCNGLQRTGQVDLTVLTTDAAGPARGDRLNVPRHDRFEAGYTVTYARHIAANAVSVDLFAQLLPAMRRADLVHLTATYSSPTLPTLAGAKLLGKPLVWSPRGALQARQEWPGASSKAKVVFEALCRRLMPRRAILHVTSEAEKELSRRAIPIPAAVVPNAVEMPPDPILRSYRPGGVLRLAFLSRVHPKKGPEQLIAALSALPANTTLAVYGEADADYLAALQSQCAAAGVSDRVTFHGHVTGTAKTHAYENADIFVLPSFSENFGMVVAEALAHRTPVVTTTATPWGMLHEAGCGRLVPPGDSAALAAATAELASGDLAAMGAAGRALVEARYGEAELANAMIEVYAAVMSGGFSAPSP
ncbi:MAG: glycosyltransferase [Pseudomonadota bacterium]